MSGCPCRVGGPEPKDVAAAKVSWVGAGTTAHIRASGRDRATIDRAKNASEQGHLDGRRPGRIADSSIGHCQRLWVAGATDRHAEVERVVSAGILNGGKEAGSTTSSIRHESDGVRRP